MASVVHCDLLPIGSHIYRIRTQSIGGRHQQHQPWTSVNEEDQEGWLDQAAIDNEEELIDSSLITQEGGNFITRIAVDPQVFPFVIGKDGHKKKEIESATGATLLIPRTSRQQQQQQQQRAADNLAILGSSKSETITIKASSKAALSSARIRTELVISSAINSRLLDWTHFVSLPLSNEQTTAKLAEFQQKVLSQPGAADKGFHPSIFVNPKTLHLTLLMLKLYSDEARHTARQVLQNMAAQVRQVLEGRPLQLQLRGLEHMTDDPTDMHVLYLEVQGVGENQQQQQHLQELSDLVVRSFKEADLLVQGQPESVKLHATIVNTRYRRASGQQPSDGATTAAGQDRAEQPGSNTRRGREGFSGKELLADFADLDLGQYTVPAIHLSERGAYDTSGYYKCFEKLYL